MDKFVDIMWWVMFVPAFLYWLAQFYSTKLNQEYGARVTNVPAALTVIGLSATAFIVAGLFI